MSQKYYKDISIKETKNLQEICELDEQLISNGPYEDTAVVKFKIGNLFIRYAQISNTLSEAADELRDPVSAASVRKFYELTLSRALQLSNDLSRLVGENSPSLDDILIRLNQTPYDIQLKVPEYLTSGRAEEVKKRREWFENLQIQLEDEAACEEDVEEDVKESVKQSQEELREQSIVPHSTEHVYSGDKRDGSLMKSEKSVVLLNNNEVFNQIEETSWEKDMYAKERNRKAQQITQEKYKELCEKIEGEVRDGYRSKFEENVEDEIREWMKSFYLKSGQFPPYPTDEQVFVTGETYGVPKKILKTFPHAFNGPVATLPKGNYARNFAKVPKLNGSALITAGCWVQPDEWIFCQAKMKEIKGKKAKPKPQNKKNLPQKNTGDFLFGDTEYFKILKQLQETYTTEPEENEVRENAFCKLELEVRNNIDDMMRLELELLQDALYKDMHPKKKRKKRQKKRGKGKKRKKDLTAGKTLEECMEELVRHGVLMENKGSKLEDFVGDRSWAGLPETSNGEIIDLVIQRCILPLLSETVHQLAPLTRSLCFFGPSHSGKHYLVDSIAAATNALIFCLSPAETAHIYPGKKGLQYLMALVKRVSRELQPSIIFIQDIEKVFYKKIPKLERKIKPTRLQKVLIKYVKEIKEDARVLVLATSNQPWLAKGKKFMKVFDRFLYIPSKHYGTHLSIWQKFFSESKLQIESTALSKMSSREGYSFQDIKEAALLGKKDFEDVRKAAEKTLDIIVEKPRVEDKVMKKYSIFFSKTPLGVTRNLLTQPQEKVKFKVKK